MKKRWATREAQRKEEQEESKKELMSSFLHSPEGKKNY